MTKNIYWKYMHNHNRTKAAQRQPWMQILQMFYVFPFLQVHLLRKQFIGCDVSNICVFLHWRVEKSCSWSHKFIFSLFYLFAFTLALLPFSIHLHWIAFSLFFLLVLIYFIRLSPWYFVFRSLDGSLWFVGSICAFGFLLEKSCLKIINFILSSVLLFDIIFV